MTKQNKQLSADEFDRDIKLATRMLKTDVIAIARLIGLAKDLDSEKEIEIRRIIRPIAVELLYMVIGTPKIFEEVLSEMEEQENGHDN